jgi:hypothetical protein
MRENPLGGKAVMPLKRYKPEQIVTMLRQIEVGIANGKTTPQACKEATITACSLRLFLLFPVTRPCRIWRNW